MKILNDWKLLLMACLTIGLAPFFPEPHILGKIKWVLGGANGMQMMDWLDLTMHGLPWLLLIRFGILKFFGKIPSSINSSSDAVDYKFSQRKNKT